MPTNLRFLRAALLAATLPLLATGCESIFGSGELERERDELEDARALWEQRGSDSYEMVVSRVCFCGAILRVRVRVLDGVVVSRVDDDTGQPLAGTPYDNMYSYIDTVEEQFALIDGELDDHPHEADASYDPEFGFPLDASFDPVENMIDEEHGFVVHELTFLPVAL